MSLDAETFDALIDTVRRFVAERLRPLEAEVEEADAIPAQIVEESCTEAVTKTVDPRAKKFLGANYTPK